MGGWKCWTACEVLHGSLGAAGSSLARQPVGVGKGQLITQSLQDAPGISDRVWWDQPGSSGMERDGRQAELGTVTRDPTPGGQGHI